MTSIKQLTLAIILFGFISSCITSQQDVIALATKIPTLFHLRESEHSFKRFDIYYPIKLRRSQTEIRDK